jgi:hypothetical protein
MLISTMGAAATSAWQIKAGRQELSLLCILAITNVTLGSAYLANKPSFFDSHFMY